MGIPVLDITEAVAEEACRVMPGLRVVGLVATRATVRALGRGGISGRIPAF